MEQPSEQISEGPHRDDPDVKAEIQYIENGIVTVDTGIISKYGAVQGCSDRLVKLKGLPRSNGLRVQVSQQVQPFPLPLSAAFN